MKSKDPEYFRIKTPNHPLNGGRCVLITKSRNSASTTIRLLEDKKPWEKGELVNIPISELRSICQAEVRDLI